MDANEKKGIIKRERVLVLQACADYICRATEHKSFAEAFPDVEDKYGTLNNIQESLLHKYLAGMFYAFGLDLDAIIKEKGEVLSEGEVLTDLEQGMLLFLVDNYLQVFGIMMERKEKLKDKK